MSWVPIETFNRVTAQPGSMPKNWDREELIRCRATGTGITAETNLKGRVHPVFADWIETELDLRKELEQPLLLASRILEAVGLPWLSDFLVDDIFDASYPGSKCGGPAKPASACGDGATIPPCIVRHRRLSREARGRRRGAARDALRGGVAGAVRWQADGDMFRQRGWSGHTCKHPRGGLPLGEVDRYETIETFDRLSARGSTRNLTVLLMAEYPARLAELRRQGRARGEEYLLTAFMTTVTLLHEIGHAVYWKDRRSLTRDLREPFYGGDLEMGLGDSFVAAIFGGWIPVPVRGLSELRKDFSLADGIAWRQALSWDHHRMRPKYRTHYSISVDYIARLFNNANWSTTRQGVRALIRPQSLAGNSIALRTVGLHMPLTQANQHATAAIADFHCKGRGWVWNRQPDACFRIPQFDGCMYPELELPTADEDTIREPVAREIQKVKLTVYPPLSSLPRIAGGDVEEGEAAGQGVRTSQVGGQVTGEEAILSSLRSLSRAAAAAAVATMKLSPRKSEYSPRKFALAGPSTKIPRPVSSGSPVPRSGMGTSRSRKRDRTKASRVARGRATSGQLQRERLPPSPPSTSPSVSPSSPSSPSRARGQIKQRRKGQGATRAANPLPTQRVRWDQQLAGRPNEGDEHVSYGRLGGCRDGDNVGNHDRGGEISVDELKKRLSQLIGVSLTELEGLFDGPH